MRKESRIEWINNTFLSGMRIRLLKMDDIQAPPTGTEGTVLEVDDLGYVLVAWDNGSGLNVVIGEDKVVIVKE